MTKERSRPESLATLRDGFYQSILEAIENAVPRKREQITDMLSEFTRLRTGKIIQFASTTGMPEEVIECLTSEEKELYEEIGRAAVKFKKTTFPEVIE